MVVAGGIDTPEKAEHYLSLGASGIQIATPFVATEECDAHRAFKEAYVRAKDEDVVILKSPVGMPAEALKMPSWSGCIGARSGKFIADNVCSTAIRRRFPIGITEALIRAVRGDVENGLIFCGANVGKIEKISTVHTVIENIFG